MDAMRRNYDIYAHHNQEPQRFKSVELNARTSFEAKTNIVFFIGIYILSLMNERELRFFLRNVSFIDLLNQATNIQHCIDKSRVKSAL